MNLSLTAYKIVFVCKRFFFYFIGGYMCDLIAVSHPFSRFHVVGSQLYPSCRGF